MWGVTTTKWTGGLSHGSRGERVNGGGVGGKKPKASTKLAFLNVITKKNETSRDMKTEAKMGGRKRKNQVKLRGRGNQNK